MTGRSRALLAASLIVGASAVAPLAWSAESVSEPADYRMDDYRSPVPDTLVGAEVLDTAGAAELWREHSAVFIDVLPKPPRPKLPPGTVFRLPPRDNIPGSVWLPDVGYGVLNAEMAAYFRSHLDEAVNGDKSKAVVFYCLADCWMSWNAAKRALEWGYTAVYWYPEGTDGWTFENLPLDRAEPVERPGMSE